MKQPDLGVIWRIDLDDPVDRGDVQTSRRHVRTQQDGLFGVAELEKRLGTFCLLLLSLYYRD